MIGRRLTWVIFPMIAILAGVQMFVLKYQVIEQEDELKRIHRQILDDSREIHMLEAEWALANDPNRLLTFVQTQTDWEPIRARQFVELDALPIKAVPAPTAKPDFDETEADN